MEHHALYFDPLCKAAAADWFVSRTRNVTKSGWNAMEITYQRSKISPS